jgi:hypothetical protein
VSFDVRLTRGGQPFFTFGSHTPFLEPEHRYDHNETEPPRLVSVTKTWTVDGRLYGASEAEVLAAWTALTKALEDPAQYPEAAELRRDGVVVEAISPATGYRRFRIEHLSAPRIERAWRTELRFVAKISGVRVFPAFGSTNSPVSKLTLSESWAYAETGLLTRTLTGELEVVTGAKASAVARTLGLKIPGPNFGFVTRGPEGVDVERLDEADLKARFTSIVQEAGAPLPTGVAPSYARTLHVTRSNGETLSTVTANASGPGAEAAVRAEKPAGTLTESVTVDPFRRTATAVYVTSKLEGGRLLRSHRFSTRGGGRPIRYTRRTGGRLPAKHVLQRAEVEIQEEISIEVTGTPGMQDFTLPAPLAGVDEDTSELSFSPFPTRVVLGATRAADKWVMGVRRVYRAHSLGDTLDDMGRSVIAPGAGSNPEREAARSDGG